MSRRYVLTFEVPGLADMSGMDALIAYGTLNKRLSDALAALGETRTVYPNGSRGFDLEFASEVEALRLGLKLSIHHGLQPELREEP